MSFLGATLAIVMTLFQGIDETGTAVARPTGEVKFSERTGSYYQVFEFYGKPPHTWEHAQRMVRGYVYEGREGQLAMVKDVETHYFLVLNFPAMRTSPMWIGLSVQCNDVAETEWVDGSSLADQSFRGFAEGELRKISRECRRRKDSGEILPVFYEPDAFGVRWRLGRKGENKTLIMVEFAAPIEEETAAQEGDQ